MLAPDRQSELSDQATDFDVRNSPNQLVSCAHTSSDATPQLRSICDVVTRQQTIDLGLGDPMMAAPGVWIPPPVQECSFDSGTTFVTIDLTSAWATGWISNDKRAPSNLSHSTPPHQRRVSNLRGQATVAEIVCDNPCRPGDRESLRTF